MEEGQLFLSYFKGGIFYLEGGVESGFKHVEPKVYEKKLYIVKGKRYPRVWTKELKADSLNEGDVFILDLGMKLYFWPGKDCNVNEKVKGMEVLFNIKNGERGALAKHYYPREDSVADDEFWAELGGRPEKINDAIPDDNVQEGASEDADTRYALYRVSNATGKLETTEIAERPLRKDHLDTNDTFILELNNQIYVWIGKKANTEEKKSGMLFAKEFIQ
jgi:Gelsolin repeat